MSNSLPYEKQEMTQLFFWLLEVSVGNPYLLLVLVQDNQQNLTHKKIQIPCVWKNDHMWENTKDYVRLILLTGRKWSLPPM